MGLLLPESHSHESRTAILYNIWAACAVVIAAIVFTSPVLASDYNTSRVLPDWLETAWDYIFAADSHDKLGLFRWVHENLFRQCYDTSRVVDKVGCALSAGGSGVLGVASTVGVLTALDACVEFVRGLFS